MLEAKEVAGERYAVLTSPDENDGVIISSTQKLPSTYLAKADIQIIDFDLSLTDRPENGFYWNSIMDARPIGPAHNAWTHEHRKVSIDIDNHTSDPNHGVYILYYCGEGLWDNLFWNGTEWVADWVPAFRYEDGAWYHTEIEKTDTQYRIAVSCQGGALITEAFIDIASVAGADEDWFYLGEPHTNNWYTGTAAVDNLSVTATNNDAWYDHAKGCWSVTCQLPPGLQGGQDLSLEVQYNTDEIVRGDIQYDSLIVVPEPAALGLMGVLLLSFRKRRRPR